MGEVIGDVIEGNINPHFEKIHHGFEKIHSEFKGIRNEIDEIKTTMTTLVTKSYLDDKLADLEGGSITRLHKEDTKVNRLVDILRRKKVLARTNVKTLNEIHVFPTLQH